MDRKKPTDKRKSGSSKPQSDRGGKPASGNRKRVERSKDSEESKSYKTDDRPKRPYGTRSADERPKDSRPKRPYGTRPDGERPKDKDRPKRPYGARPDGERPKDNARPKRPYGARPDGERPKDNDRPKRAFGAKTDGERPKDNDRSKRAYGARPDAERQRGTDRPKPDFGTRPDTGRPKNNDRPKSAQGARPGSGMGGDGYKPKKQLKGGSPDKFFGKPKPVKAERPEKDYDKWEKRSFPDKDKPKPAFDKRGPRPDIAKRSFDKSERKPEVVAEVKNTDPVLIQKQEVMPLNKYVSHCGVCSRRDAIGLIKEGKVKVNGEVMLQPGYKVQLSDKVEYGDKIISSKRNLVYILLNKPKNYITTTDDPQERRTVMDLVADAGPERIYPVGRLDRNTTGLLLLTNDGELAQKLSHPKYSIKKVYHVVLDKILTQPHFDLILKGLELEDGIVNVDALAYLENKKEIGIEIHSGRNRIVRRIFEHLGYVVDKLDRVMYAGLTKKNIPRAKWRFLKAQEIINLKYYK